MTDSILRRIPVVGGLGYIDQVRAKLGDPTFALGDDTPIVLERFRIVERLDPGEAG